MYPSVVTCLKFHLARFPSSIPGPATATATAAATTTTTTITRRRNQPPSTTHLLVLLALQKLLSQILLSKQEKQFHLSDGHFHGLMVCLRDSFIFARQLNDQIQIRQRLFQKEGWQYGMITNKKEEDTSSFYALPSMLPQEMHGKEEYLKVLFHLIQQNSPPSPPKLQQDARKQMML
jgi:brefeldin A-inhibited guanine nucleotide-exchange protein